MTHVGKTPNAAWRSLADCEYAPRPRPRTMLPAFAPCPTVSHPPWFSAGGPGQPDHVPLLRESRRVPSCTSLLHVPPARPSRPSSTRVPSNRVPPNQTTQHALASLPRPQQAFPSKRTVRGARPVPCGLAFPTRHAVPWLTMLRFRVRTRNAGAAHLA
jgi:hypothetical protein